MQRDNHSGSMVWITTILVLFTFAAMDAGALAWSAAIISGRQLAAELLTYFTIIGGGAVTVWWMKDSPIQDVECTWLESDMIQHQHIVDTSVGNMDEGRNTTAQI
jgi:hypothetical protein